MDAVAHMPLGGTSASVASASDVGTHPAHALPCHSPKGDAANADDASEFDVEYSITSALLRASCLGMGLPHVERLEGYAPSWEHVWGVFDIHAAAAPERSDAWVRAYIARVDPICAAYAAAFPECFAVGAARGADDEHHLDTAQAWTAQCGAVADADAQRQQSVESVLRAARDDLPRAGAARCMRHLLSQSFTPP
uniref:Uncharacterized protein n=1 Tax=viral metagenome TaxID=1070528 RepID=A0A6C0AUY2_9ZZZZ